MRFRLKDPLLILAAGGLAFAGCSSLQPVTDTTRYYTLVSAASAPAATTAAPDGPRIGVRVSVQTDYLRRKPIAVRVGTNEIRLEENHRWAERIDEAVERALTGKLQQRLPTTHVLPVSQGSASGAAVVVDLTVSACEGTTDGAAVLEGYWKVNAGTRTEPAMSGHFRRSRPGWDGADYGQLAGLLGELVDELAAEIAPAIPPSR